ncbi:DNA-binding protein [bacterium M00.F.Ca.ET.228.01.1.1]|nr:DNA-binding protein [bacterium M00.F.Ca.ET.228.01.1.1]TGR95541.1 DNA-binding protein [bacterium M00.F.Ca.ET.191.01.1.1]TGT96530.1 DNA-binding protein [bacterium M00.F.Ca.ET.155.01.1.1]
MGRQPLHDEQSVRSAALEMLAENCHGAPVSPALFRRVLSARRLRQRMGGGGDLATFSRILKAVEAEVTRDSASRDTIPDLPEPVANLMRAVWRAALDAQTGDIARNRTEAQQAVADAEEGRDEANAVVALLQTELQDLRRDLAARDETIGRLRAELAEATRQLASSDTAREQLSRRLVTIQHERDTDRRTVEEQLAAVRTRYDGLHRQLLEQTDAQRQAWVDAKRALEQQLRAAEERLTEVRAERQRLLDELGHRARPRG